MLKKTREEVEAGLKNRTASIANRLERLESEIPIAPASIRRLTEKKTLVKLGISVAAGAVIGMIAVRIRRNPNRLFRQELGHVSESIGKEIRKNMKRGLSEEEAVSQALDKRPPVVNIGRETGSFWSSLLAQLARHVASALGPVIADKITARFKGPTPDEK